MFPHGTKLIIRIRSEVRAAAVTHTISLMMERGLHRCVQVILTNTTLIYNALASKHKRGSVF